MLNPLLLLSSLLLQAAPAAPPEPLLAPLPPARDRVLSWDDAVARLRRGSPDLRLALAAIERAEAETRVVLAPLLPTLNASASVQHSLVTRRQGTVPLESGGTVNVGGDMDRGSSPTSPLGVLRASAAVPLVDVSAWHALRAARAGENAARWSYAEVQRLAYQSLAQALVAAVAAERFAELTRGGLVDALERHRLTTESERLGAGTRLDTLRTLRDLEIARSEVATANEAVRQSREAIGLVLGTGTPVGVDPRFTLDGLVRGASAACRAVTDTPRADVAAAEATVKQAERDLSRARSEYLPTLAAQSTATALTVEPGFARVNTWNLAVVLSVPIFEGGVRAGGVRGARAALADAEGRLAATRSQSTVDIARARRGVEVADTLVSAGRGARDAAAHADLLTRESFRAGVGTSLELVESAVARRVSERTLVGRELDLVNARISAVLAEAVCPR